MTHKLHHHHKHEAAQHKVKEHHRSAHHSKKAHEHSSHPHMHEHGNPGHMSHLIGGVVHDDHQQGISRKLVKKGDMDVGQHGSMSGGWKHEHHMKELTPRKG